MNGVAQKRPDLRRVVAVCMACRHWQIDFRAAAISEHGGWMESMHALSWVHSRHVLDECVGTPGRVKVGDSWATAPEVQDGSGKPADGSLEITMLPRWWVTR